LRCAGARRDRIEATICAASIASWRHEAIDCDLDRHRRRRRRDRRPLPLLARHPAAGDQPGRFQKGLDGVTADYALRDDGKIRVLNSGCQGDPEGERSTAEGRAIIADEATGAKLKVSFFGPLYTGDYWVLDHGDDYDWSIVGEPSGRYLWLLSREAKPAPGTVEALLKRVEALGYDRWALRITQQR
jgi:lipocalin